MYHYDSKEHIFELAEKFEARQQEKAEAQIDEKSEEHGSVLKDLKDKQKEIAIYNRSAETPIEAGVEEEIRYEIMIAYLALIEEVEKYVRYEPDEENYIRNTVDARDMYDLAFGILE